MSDIVDISIRKNKAADDRVFKERFRECRHGSYIVDETLNQVTCGLCKKELNPMWVLKDLAMIESNNRHRLSELKRELKSTENKMHCKCDKCGKMTRIAK